MNACLMLVSWFGDESSLPGRFTRNIAWCEAEPAFFLIRVSISGLSNLLRRICHCETLLLRAAPRFQRLRGLCPVFRVIPDISRSSCAVHWAQYLSALTLISRNIFLRYIALRCAVIELFIVPVISLMFCTFCRKRNVQHTVRCEPTFVGVLSVVLTSSL